MSLMESFEDWARQRHYQHTDYGQMIASQCNAADNCVMDPACPFIATCTEAQSRAPAAQPVNLQTAQPEGTSMSLATDVENAYNAAKNELAGLEQHLPGLIAKGRQIENNPLADIAIKAGEAVASAILPPEAVTMLTGTVSKLLDDLIGLYNPVAPAADAQPVTAAPAA